MTNGVDNDLTLDEGVIQGWVGNAQHVSDVVSMETCHRMAATVGWKGPICAGDQLPPLWHWLFFHAAVPTSDLGKDGHAKLGGFLPPVALPRRMWAGGRLKFESPLLVGSAAVRESRILHVSRKRGSSGELCFVTVAHTYSQQDTVRLVEEHDIVYREAAPVTDSAQPSGAAAVRAAGVLATQTSPHSLRVTPSVSALFRYSALTFNSHRIHFDRDYCLREEQYAGLVVHGPLTATLMANLAQSCRGQPLKVFEFKALAPLIDTDTFDIEADDSGPHMRLTARKADGQVAMQASAAF